MTTFPVQLTSVSDIKAFVDAANRLDCDVDVECGRYLVNGKSIMGLFSIDLSAPVQVQVHGSQAQSDISVSYTHLPRISLAPVMQTRAHLGIAASAILALGVIPSSATTWAASAGWLVT